MISVMLLPTIAAVVLTARLLASSTTTEAFVAINGRRSLKATKIPDPHSWRQLSSSSSKRTRTTSTTIFTAASIDVDQLLPSKAVNDGPSFENSINNSIAVIEDFTTTTNSTVQLKSSSSSSSISSRSFPSTPSLRDCLAFALPALGIYTCPPLMSLIDASFIGQQSLTLNKHASLELAALGPASSISDSAPLPLLFLSIAATNLIAASTRRHQQQQKQQQSSSSSSVAVQIATPDQARVTRVALGMGTIGGIILAVALYFGAGPLSSLYCGGSAAGTAAATATSSASALTTEFCRSYVSIRALALPAVVVTTIAQAVCIGTKDTSTPMIAVFVAGALNLMGDFLLVKKLQMGIAGAAWATSMSQIVAGGLLLYVLKNRGFLRDPLKPTKDDNNTRRIETTSTSSPAATMTTVRQLLSFVPFLFVMAVKIGWHNSCAATAASLGGAQAAAHSALVSVAMLCFVLGDVGSSMSQAFLPAFVVTKADNNNTEKTSDELSSSSSRAMSYFDLDAAMPTIKQLLKCTLSISTTVMIIASVIIGFFPTQITRDPAVVAEMRKALPWIVTALSFHGSAVTLEGLLLARKKFRPLSIFYSLLAVGVAAFQVSTRRFHWGLAGVWGCYVWFCATRVVTFSALGGLLQPSKLIDRIRHKFATNHNDNMEDESTLV
jgi:Na+-driven multidrug efflux pump